MNKVHNHIDGNRQTIETLASFSSEHPLETNKVLFKAQDLGVEYFLGGKREDYQSRTYNFLFRNRKRPSFWALNNINLQGNAGDVIGIIGMNGAGKTTLCRVIAGLIRPDTGSIKVNGSVSALLSLGTGFNPNLSGRENIYLNGMILGFSKSYLDKVVDDIIMFSEIENFIEQPLKNYSNGMKARLGFSIATMFEPDILILDEALSTGDLHFSSKAGEKLQATIRQSKMVLMVSHQLEFVKKNCNRAIWIDKGTIIAAGNPENVIHKYTEASKKLPKRTVAPINFKKTNAQIGALDVVKAVDLGIKFSFARQKDSLKIGWRRYITQRYNIKKDFWALKGVSFRVREGDILGIIGLNAAGKSTLCRALSGILKPDAGSIKVHGNITALLTIGTGFNLQLSGKDNVFLNGMLLGFSKNEVDNLYQDIVDFSELGHFIEQPVKNYSSGMRARLGFSIVAMLKPDVFIIDEALNAGDISFYEKSANKIQELMAHAKATIVVTHNVNFVEKVCTRALWLDSGSVAFQGDPKETIDRYRQSIKKR
jgi:teichoic acid transport system ATP-binding protein